MPWRTSINSTRLLLPVPDLSVTNTSRQEVNKQSPFIMSKEGDPSPSDQPPWHTMTKEDVIKELGLPSDIRKKGLTTAEAVERLEKYGPNQLTVKEKESIWVKMWKDSKSMAQISLQ